MSLLLDNDFSYKIHQVKSTNKHKTTIILMQYRKKKKILAVIPSSIINYL